MKEGLGNSGRDERGRFTKGNPGGPGGPRRRQSELRRAAEEAITPEHVAAMVRKATRMGLEGNLAAMRLVLERTCGRAAPNTSRPEPLGISLPPLNTPEDCNTAVARLMDGICRGTVDREAAKILIDAIETRLKAIEVKVPGERGVAREPPPCRGGLQAGPEGRGRGPEKLSLGAQEGGFVERHADEHPVFLRPPPGCRPRWGQPGPPPPPCPVGPTVHAGPAHAQARMHTLEKEEAAA